MSYRIKSLLYFVTFLASAVLYYTMEPEFDSKNNRESAEVIQLKTVDLENNQKVAKLDEVPEE